MSNSRPPVSQRTRMQARQLRRNLTEAEATLWALLRDRRLSHLKWRRQAPIGAYIVDFICLEHRLIVECDGSQHADNPRDAVRDAWLVSQDYQILRVWNHEVAKQRASVIDTILARCGLPF